jgi:ubiquinol-cytochrome c reductase cytochrome c1 subunit
MPARRRLAATLGMLMVAGAIGAGPARAIGEAETPVAQSWPFEGIFGQFEHHQLQRGLQVYLGVCANCHGLRLVAYRDLALIGYNEDQITAIAKQYEVEDGPNKDGEMFKRPARASDRFVSPYPNDKAAAAANGGNTPPDLSLMYKARAGGADYIHALLTGYEDPPADVKVPPGAYYNPYFSGHFIAMPPPLYGDDVVFDDGTPATVEQEARDVAAFLAWTAEPMLDRRKRMGLAVILFTIVMTGLFYASKRRVWSALH